MTDKTKDVSFRCVSCGAIEEFDCDYVSANTQLGERGWEIRRLIRDKQPDTIGLHCPQCVRETQALAGSGATAD